jgi:hypothetical protein
MEKTQNIALFIDGDNVAKSSFQENFDDLLTRVENGESFMITSEHGNVMIIPYNDDIKILEDSSVDSGFIHIHTDHEDAS